MLTATPKSWLLRGALLSSVASASLFLSTIPASAYSGTAAAGYADAFARSYNYPAYPEFGSDCTNFVSQSVHAGGYAKDPGSSNTNDLYWWMTGAPGTYSWSHSWTVAYDYWQFLINDYPGGIYEGSASGMATNYYTPNSVVTGDVLFFDWGQGLGISHDAIQVGIGTDPNYPNGGQVWYGNYVDYHTNPAYHHFWSLYPYNPNRKTTVIYFQHIDARNGNN